MHKNKIDIIVINDTQEALSIRSALEYWGAITRTYFIGKVKDLVDILDGKEELSQNILIMCHGNNKGIILPEIDEKIAKQQPYNKFLTPKNLSEFLKLNGQNIICTGCATGTKKFADVFLDAGAKNYIAPKNYPEGNASLFYVLNLYYFLFIKNLSIKESHKKAKLIDSDAKMFELFEK